MIKDVSNPWIISDSDLLMHIDFFDIDVDTLLVNVEKKAFVSLFSPTFYHETMEEALASFACILRVHRLLSTLSSKSSVINLLNNFASFFLILKTKSC